MTPIYYFLAAVGIILLSLHFYEKLITRLIYNKMEIGQRVEIINNGEYLVGAVLDFDNKKAIVSTLFGTFERSLIDLYFIEE